MINEEISNKTLSIAVGEGKNLFKAIQSAMDKTLALLRKEGKSLEKYLKDHGSEVKLKDLVKKGQLEEVQVKDTELKQLRKELNRCGVKFSVMKDKETGNHSVFFQARDLKVMENAFKRTLAKVSEKSKDKPSIISQIRKFREMAKNTISKDKVKNKHKEQSL